MRKEFCEKDGIYISYTNDDVCFEDITTAESILLKNNGEIIHSKRNTLRRWQRSALLPQCQPRSGLRKASECLP